MARKRGRKDAETRRRGDAEKQHEETQPVADQVDEMLKRPKTKGQTPAVAPGLRDASAGVIRRERMQDRKAVRDTCPNPACGGKNLDPKQVIKDREWAALDGSGIERNRRRWTRAQCRSCGQWTVLIEDYRLA